MPEADSLAQVIFQLSSGDITDEINLKPEAWRILTRFNGACTVAEIAHSIAMEEAAAVRLADGLYKAGVLEVAPGSATPPRARVDDLFFAKISRELARSLGPLADAIIDDEISALGEARQRFPRDRAAELVERVSEDIRDERKRLGFQRVMLEAIGQLSAQV